MRDIKNRTRSHSLEFADAREEQTGAAPEYAPIGQEFADVPPEFIEPEEHHVSSIPEEFHEGGFKKESSPPDKSRHRLLRKAGYLITATVAAVTLVNPSVTPWGSMFIEAENISSVDNEPEESEETAPPTPEPEETAQPTTEPEMTAEPEEEIPISFIFSHMPVAAYEVTGLGVGRFESVFEEEIYVEYDD